MREFQKLKILILQIGVDENMEEILYNQQVTAETLSDIEIDLGNPEFTFTETKFGADALNGITDDLINAGVLNTLNKCNVTVSDNKINIDTGIIVFSGGAKLRITTPIALDFTDNCYVYAKHDTAINKIYAVASPTAPTGNYIMLAKITDGAVEMKRTFATGKTSLTGGNVTRTVQLTGTANLENTTEKVLAKEIDMEGMNYSKIIIERSGDYSSNYDSLNFALYDVTTGKIYYMRGTGTGARIGREESNKTQFAYHASGSYYYRSYISVEIEDGKVKLYFSSSRAVAYASESLSGFNLILA